MYFSINVIPGIDEDPKKIDTCCVQMLKMCPMFFFGGGVLSDEMPPPFPRKTSPKKLTNGYIPTSRFGKRMAIFGRCQGVV